MSTGNQEQSSDDMWEHIKRDFEKGELIGYGRDDTLICRGTQRATGRRVCFKVIPVRNAVRRSDALREAEMLAAAKHENVLEFIAVYQSRSEVVIVTELCDADMLDTINTHGRFTENEAREHIKHVIKALRFCHERGVAHRDVKLDNIFQSFNGTLKLGDFGFAVRYRPNEILLTSCGTLSYAAPELLKPRGHVHCRPEAADVWSAGVVLFALVAGKLPFHGDDDAALIAQIRSGYWSAPRDLSDPLRDLLRKMLSVDPTARPTLADVLRHKWTREPLIRSESFSVAATAIFQPVPRASRSSMCASDMKKKRSFFKKHLLRLLVTPS